MSTNKSPQALLRPDRSSSPLFDQQHDAPGDLAQRINDLDKALDGLNPTGDQSKQILKELQRISTTYVLLPSSHVLTPSQLSVGKSPFATGGFSDVFQGSYNGSVVCVKRLRMASTSSLEKTRKMLYREALVWKRLKHANIVPFIGVTLNPLQIVSEWMSRGNLTAYIRSNPDTDRVTLLVDVAKGLHYLHLCDVVHGDLKGPNIMVDAQGIARITDFGLAYNQNALEQIHSTSSGTLRWMAPEISQEKSSPSKGADVFSFAMVMIEVFTGAAPFNIHPSVTATLVIMQGKRPPRPDHPGLTDKLWGLMQRCWNQEPQLRPGMSEVLEVLEQPDVPPTIGPPPPGTDYPGKILRNFPSRKNTSPIPSRPTSPHENKKARSRVDSQTALQDQSPNVTSSHPDGRHCGQPSGTITRASSRRSRVTSEPMPPCIEFHPFGFGSVQGGQANPIHDYIDGSRKYRVSTSGITNDRNRSRDVGSSEFRSDINRESEYNQERKHRSGRRGSRGSSRSRFDSGGHNRSDPSRSLSRTRPPEGHPTRPNQAKKNAPKLRRSWSCLDLANADDGSLLVQPLKSGISGVGDDRAATAANNFRREITPWTRSPHDSWVHIAQMNQGPLLPPLLLDPPEPPPEPSTNPTTNSNDNDGNIQEQVTLIPQKRSGLWGRLKKTIGLGKGWK